MITVLKSNQTGGGGRIVRIQKRSIVRSWAATEPHQRGTNLFFTEEEAKCLGFRPDDSSLYNIRPILDILNSSVPSFDVDAHSGFFCVTRNVEIVVIAQKNIERRHVIPVTCDLRFQLKVAVQFICWGNALLYKRTQYVPSHELFVVKACVHVEHCGWVRTNLELFY